eukprot:465447_1
MKIVLFSYKLYTGIHTGTKIQYLLLYFESMSTSALKPITTIPKPKAFPEVDVPLKVTTNRFKKIHTRKWIKPEEKYDDDSLSLWVCKKKKSDSCVTEFNSRRTLQTIQTIQNTCFHHHRHDINELRKVSEFVYTPIQSVEFSDGSHQDMICLLGEKRPPRPIESQLKTIRRTIHNACATDDKRSKEWDAVRSRLHLDDVYGINPNKFPDTKSHIGKEAVHHLLNSDEIREWLKKYTPSDTPPIIPDHCTLRFWLQNDVFQINESSWDPVFDGIDLHKLGYVSLGRFQLSQYSAADTSSTLSKLFDGDNYSSKLTVDWNTQGLQPFWVKSMPCASSALAAAFGYQKTAYMMRYRPALCFQIGRGMLVISGKMIGGGFCNLVQKKRTYDGHSMLHFNQTDMDKICFDFYGKEGMSIGDIKMYVMTYKTQNNVIIEARAKPVVLFDGSKLAITDSHAPNTASHDPRDGTHRTAQHQPQQQGQHTYYEDDRSGGNLTQTEYSDGGPQESKHQESYPSEPRNTPSDMPPPLSPEMCPIPMYSSDDDLNLNSAFMLSPGELNTEYCKVNNRKRARTDDPDDVNDVGTVHPSKKRRPN